jgi:hypothetical protein
METHSTLLVTIGNLISRPACPSQEKLGGGLFPPLNQIFVGQAEGIIFLLGRPLFSRTPKGSSLNSFSDLIQSSTTFPHCHLLRC